MQEWKKELCREQPETLQELGKGTYIQRRNITPYERKDGNGEADKGYSCEYRILTKEEYFAALEQENSNKNMLTSMAAQADIYEKLIETEKNQNAHIFKAAYGYFACNAVFACFIYYIYVFLADYVNYKRGGCNRV